MLVVTVAKIIPELELARGLSWTLSEGIANSITEDCPHFFHRLVTILHSTMVTGPSLLQPTAPSSLSARFIKVAKDVFIRAAKNLDVLYKEREGNPSWESEYIRVWEQFVAHHNNTTKSPVELDEMLNALINVTPRDFLSNVFPDFIGELGNSDAVDAWRTRNRSNAKFKDIMDMLDIIYPN
jgi:hypothetical protein